MVKLKRREYDLPEPKAQDVLAIFDIGESQAGQQLEFDKAQTKFLIDMLKRQDVHEVIMMDRNKNIQEGAGQRWKNPPKHCLRWNNSLTVQSLNLQLLLVIK